MPLGIATEYRPRNAEHLETFLDAAAHHADGSRLPAFVEQEFRDFLACGVLERGFARLRGPAHDGVRGPPRRRRAASRARAPVGAEHAAPAPVSPRVGSFALPRGARGVRARAAGLPSPTGAPARSPRRTLGVRDCHPAVRRWTQPERPFPHARPRGRLRGRCGRSAAVLGPAAADGRRGRDAARGNRHTGRACAPAPGFRERRGRRVGARPDRRRVARARGHQ